MNGFASLSPCPHRNRTSINSRSTAGQSLLRLAFLIFCLVMLRHAGYLSAAQEKPAPGAGELEPAKKDAGPISPEQIKELLRTRSQAQLQEKPAEPSTQTETTTTEAQVETEKAPATQSVLELLFSGQIPGVVSPRLSQFGYDVFARPVSTFAPVTNVPVGPDYVVGPGDSFTVTLWGRVNVQYSVTVDRGGEIVFPEVGVLKVWGMAFSKLESYLEHELSRKHTDFKMAVTMDRLRSITVYVVGEAKTPGSYTVSSLSTVINALFAAGGPSKNGTLRTVQLLRQGSQPVTIDMYKFLLGGDKSEDMRLQDGDTVFISLIGPVVGVAGNVKRPAIYEVPRPMTLSEVLDLAGGVTYAGWLQRVQVERFENHKRRIVVDFDISSKAGTAVQEQALQTVIQDGDLIKIFPVSAAEQNVVYLEGHVIRPGKYELKPGMRLADLIHSYDVLQSQPNLDYGEIERLVEPDFHPVVIPFNVGKLLKGEQPENIELSRFDTVRVFRWDDRVKETVGVSGLVFRPGDYRLIPDMRVSDLIDTAGGLMKNAYLRTAEITRRHVNQRGMETERIEIDLEKAMSGVSEHNIVLQDYDHLIVRPVPELEFDRVAVVSGEVRFPGTYPVQRGETLSSLIERAGGFTERAYLKGAIFTRESARVIQQDRMDRLVRQLEESMLTRAEETASAGTTGDSAAEQQVGLNTKKELIAKLRAARIDGRVVVRLIPLEKFRGSKYDLGLEKNDNLFVPETPGIVTVVGEVFNPTALLYEKDQTVSYYLNRVGGMTREADKKTLSVIKVDGSVVSALQRGATSLSWDSQYHQWALGGLSNMHLDPGDTVVVPRKMDKFLWLRTTKDITQIIFQIALTAGVVLAL